MPLIRGHVILQSVPAAESGFEFHTQLTHPHTIKIPSDKPQSLTHTHTHHTCACTSVHTHTHFYGRRDMSLSLTQIIRDLTCDPPEFISTAFVFNPWVGKISWRRKWQPTPVFLPGKSHGQRNLVGYSPWGCKELDTTERLHFLCVRVP